MTGDKTQVEKLGRPQQTLGELISAVAGESRNDQETLVAVADLLESGLVRLSEHGRRVRAHVTFGDEIPQRR